MINRWFKLSIVALTGLIVSYFALGVLSWLGQPNYSNNPFTQTQNHGRQNFGMTNAPGQRPNINVQENVGVRIQRPNGTSIQINKSEGMGMNGGGK